MNQLLVKFCKNENNIDIPLYQMYLSKLHKKFLEILYIEFIERNHLRIQLQL